MEMEKLVNYNLINSFEIVVKIFPKLTLIECLEFLINVMMGFCLIKHLNKIFIPLKMDIIQDIMKNIISVRVLRLIFYILNNKEFYC